nr:protein FAR1-RELATED SEQUENCE 5-like [Ipomoea batatas]
MPYWAIQFGVHWGIALNSTHCSTEVHNAVMNRLRCVHMRLAASASKFLRLITYVGQRFSTLEAGITFYTTYATITRFDVWRATEKKDLQGEITWKYVLCSRAGFKLPTGEGSGVGVLLV